MDIESYLFPHIAIVLLSLYNNYIIQSNKKQQLIIGTFLSFCVMLDIQ